MTPPVQSRTTTAFYAQSVISFVVSVTAVTIGVTYIAADGWVRGFLALGMLYVVTSAFTLAKCVRDAQEATNVVSRVDQARVEKMLADYDPYTRKSL
jgi:hypothetical protein